MKQRQLGVIFVTILTLAAAPLAHADVTASEIETLAATHAAAAAQRSGLADAEVAVQRLDARLLRPTCPGGLQVLDEGAGLKAGRMVLRIGCSNPASWSVYVPVRVTYEVAVFRFRRNMQAGETLAIADLVQDRVPGHAQPPQAVTDAAPLVGMVLARGVAAGSLLDAGQLRQRTAVDQGQQVSIRVQRGGLQISMDGIALQSGITGALIQVRNLSSGKAIQARVVGPGLVEVGP